MAHVVTRRGFGPAPPSSGAIPIKYQSIFMWQTAFDWPRCKLPFEAIQIQKSEHGALGAKHEFGICFIMKNMNVIVSSCTYVYEPNLTGKTPLDSNFIGFWYTRVFRCFQKIKPEKGRKMFGISPPEMCSCSRPCCTVFKNIAPCDVQWKVRKSPRLWWS